MKKIMITASDGIELSANVYTPTDSSQPSGAKNSRAHVGGVVINSATGVKQSYYRSFSEYMASQGYVVITYDYRGIGASLNLPYRDSRLTMTNWGEQDFEAVLSFALQTHPNLNWHCIGHSVGGQIIGLAPSSHKLTSVFNVASQSGNWRLWTAKFKLQLIPVWYVLIPLLSRVLGYFPGSIIGGEHLPKHVALDWARWCRNKNYICDKSGNTYRPHFNQLTLPMHFLVIDDDHKFAPEVAVKSLAGFYENAKTDISKTTKDERDGGFLGHFGFFRQKHQVLWSKVTDWFEAHSDVLLVK